MSVEMADGLVLGEPEASISARLRDLRKPRNGAWVVERQYVARGLWRYRVRRRTEGAA